MQRDYVREGFASSRWGMDLVPRESLISVADVYQAPCQVLEGRQQFGDS